MKWTSWQARGRQRRRGGAGTRLHLRKAASSVCRNRPVYPPCESKRCPSPSFFRSFTHQSIYSFVHLFILIHRLIFRSFFWSIVQPLVCSCIELSIHPFIYSFILIHTLILSIFLFNRSVTFLSIYSFTCCSIHSCIHPSGYSVIHWFIFPFIHSLTHSLTHSFIHSFVRSFIYSFIHSSVLNLVSRNRECLHSACETMRRQITLRAFSGCTCLAVLFVLWQSKVKIVWVSDSAPLNERLFLSLAERRAIRHFSGPTFTASFRHCVPVSLCVLPSCVLLSCFFVGLSVCLFVSSCVPLSCSSVCRLFVHLYFFLCPYPLSGVALTHIFAYSTQKNLAVRKIMEAMRTSVRKKWDSVEKCFWDASFVSLFLFVGTHFRICRPLTCDVRISSKASATVALSNGRTFASPGCSHVRHLLLCPSLLFVCLLSFCSFIPSCLPLPCLIVCSFLSSSAFSVSVFFHLFLPVSLSLACLTGDPLRLQGVRTSVTSVRFARTCPGSCTTTLWARTSMARITSRSWPLTCGRSWPTTMARWALRRAKRWTGTQSERRTEGAKADTAEIRFSAVRSPQFWVSG